MTRRGRPPLDREDASAQLHLRLPSKQLTAAGLQAQRIRVSRAEWLRRAVRAALEKPRP